MAKKNAGNAWEYPPNFSGSLLFYWRNLLILAKLNIFMADIDECKEKSVCGTVARCENMLGMFDCICRQGYRYVEKTKGCPG